MTCNPVFVVRIDAVPRVGSVLTWKASIRPYPTSPSYEGRIVKRVVEFGDLTQAMSDRNGAPVVNTFELTVWDPDNFWRSKLADPNTEYLTGQDITYLFGSAEAIRAESDPLVSLFRGQLLDPSPLPRKHFSFAAESRLGTRKGAYDMDSAVNKVTAQRAVDDGFPAVPKEHIEKRLPALWGEKTDKNTPNQFGQMVDMGMVTAVNLGPLPGTTPTFLPKPTWGTPQKFLSGSAVALGTTLGSGHTYTYIFGARTINGTWSLSDPLTLAGMPAPSEFAKGSTPGHRGFGTGVRLFIDPYTNPAHITAITDPSTGNLMGNLWVKDGDASSTAPYRHMDGAGEAYTIGYDDNGDDSHYKTWGPALPAYPLAQIDTAAGDFWCFLRHPGTITQLFLSDLGGGATGGTTTPSGQAPGTTPQYAAIATADLGVSVDLGPSDTGYEFIAASGNYYFGVLLSGAKGLAARDGSFPPRANICGWPGDNGLLINQAALIAQDVIVQMTGGPNGRGSEDGTRLPIPNFTSYPAVPIVQTSRFQDVQTITKGFLGTALGYIGVVYFGPDDTSSWRQHHQQVWIDWGFDRFENEHGQEAISVPDDLQLPTDGTLLRERIEIAQVTDPGKVVSNEIQNLERYETGYAPIENVYRSGALEVRDAVSIAQYGERTPLGPGQVTSHKYTDDPPTARDRVGRMIADRAIGPSYIEVEGKLRKMLPISLGRQFRVEHSDLIQPGPIPVYLRDRTISARRGTIRLRGRSRIGSFAAIVGDNSTPLWDDATAVQRATYFYVSDDNGLMPDGSRGSRLR